MNVYLFRFCLNVKVFENIVDILVILFIFYFDIFWLNVFVFLNICFILVILDVF